MVLQNPWWSEEEWEEKDKHVREWKKQKIRWIPEWIEKISLKPFSLNIVYGARQLGKTTGIKLLIRSLLKKHDAFSVFFFDFDIVGSVREMRKIMESYLEIRKKESIDSSFIFLDEVSSVKDWWRIVKFMIDSGAFENDVITVSGSSSINLLKAPERFPGRKSKGVTIQVFPLSFPEFVKAHGFEPRKIVYKEEELKRLWEKFKTTGGFPKSINEHEDALQSFIDALVSEVRKNEKILEIIDGIISSLMGKIPSALSYHSIAKEIEVSHKTVREYIEFLEDCFVLKRAFFKSHKVFRRKEKKIFFRDPFILHSLSFWTGEKFLESALFESIVQEHLLRRFGEVYYYRNDYEIDCIAGNMKIEVKAGKPHRRYPKDVLVLGEDDIPRFLNV